MAPQSRPVSPARRRRWPWWVAGGVLFMVGLPVALAAWLLLTEAGLRAAARTAEWASDGRIVVEGPSGRLAESVRFDALRVETPDMRLRIDEFVLAWRPARLVDRHVDIDTLAFGVIEFSARPSDEETTGLAPPPPVELPLSLAVRALTIGRLSLYDWVDAPAGDTGAGPFFELRDFSTALASDRRIHRVDTLAVSLPFGELTLTADIDGGELPFALSARGTLVGVHQERDYDVAYTATGNLLELQLLLEARGMGLSGQASLDLAPFEHVPLRRLHAAIGEIDPSAFVADAPRAALTVTAALVSESVDEWRLSGPLRIDNRMPDTVDNGGIPVVSLDALLHWSPQEAAAEQLALVLPGDGTLAGSLAWRPDASGASIGRLSAALELAGIQMQRLDGRLPEALVAGRIEAEGDDAEQHARVDAQVGEARVRAEGQFQRAGGPTGEPVFSAAGALSAFDPAALLPDAPQAELNLTFDARGAFGDWLSLTLAWAFEPSSFEGLALDGRGKVVVEGERLADADVAITLAGNRVKARGAWGRPQDALSIDIDAPALAALGHGLGGQARIEATLSGTRQEPAGTLRLFAEQLVLPGDLRLDGLNASGRLAAGLDGPVEMSLGASGLGRADGETWLQSATLVVSGRRSAHRIDAAIATPDEDSLQLRLEGALLEGSTAGDGARWRGMLTQLQAAGRFPVALTAPTGLTVSRQRLVLDAARLDAGERGRIRLDETQWTPERIVARGALTGFVVEFAQHDARAPTRRPPRREREPLTFGAEWNVSLGETANGTLRVFREAGDFALTGDVTTRVGLEHVEARVDAVDNRLALSLDARGAELGTITASASVLAERSPEGGWRLAPDAALLGSARFEMPSIAWLARMLDEEVVLGGSLSGDFSLAGTPAHPLATGRIGGRELALSLVEHGLQLSGGTLQAEFDRDRLRLTRLEFLSPNRVRPPDPRVPVTRYTRTPGRLLVTGEIALESGDGAFRFEADRLPILQRTDRWLILSGEGEATSTWTTLALEAAFRADAGYVELADTPPPTLSDDVVILGRDEAPRDGALKVSADVAVSLGNELYLSALGLDTRLTGELRLRLRDGEPLSAVGTIATAGGVFRGYGQNLTVDRGLINFQGALDNPGLNVVALRKGLPVEAGISVLGSARRPQIRLVSEPNVPDPEKLSWIVLGRAPTAGAGADLGLLLPAAQALLGGSGGGMTEQLSRSLGFDEFGIGTGELGATTRAPTSRVVGDGSVVTGEGTVSGQVLTLGKRLSTDLFLSFEQSLGGAESLVKLTYQLSNRVSVVARGGSDNSADIYYTVSFR